MAELLKKITAAYELDRAHKSEAVVSAAQLPGSYEAITERWLTDILCGKYPGAAVVGYRLGPPDSGSSNRRKIYVEYNEAGRRAALPGALFCKATQDLANRIVLGVSGGARCEVTFYNDIRPLLNIEAPRSYFAKFDPESFNSIIVLADLSDAVTEFCNHKTKMTRERAESQLALLAEMHGRCYLSPQLREQLNSLPTWPEFFGNTLEFGMQHGSDQGFLAAEDVIPPRLFRRSKEIWPATVESVERHNRLPHTLTHGDVHLKNWYVAGSGEMGLSDWQCASRGHWGRDVAYAMTTALTVEDRRAWDNELLRFYIDRLHASGGPRVGIDEAFSHYRQQMLSALAWWTITLTPAAGMPDMQPRDLTLEFIRRISTAMDDVNSLESFR
jgi:Phosphotransferase enzyme family